MKSEVSKHAQISRQKKINQFTFELGYHALFLDFLIKSKIVPSLLEYPKMNLQYGIQHPFEEIDNGISRDGCTWIGITLNNVGYVIKKRSICKDDSNGNPIATEEYSLIESVDY